MISFFRLGMLPLIALMAAPLLLAEQPWPFDPDQIRARHGAVALFRFDLGVENATVKCQIKPSAGAWVGSSHQAAMEQALEKGNFYRAGQHLGGWLQQQRCP